MSRRVVVWAAVGLLWAAAAGGQEPLPEAFSIEITGPGGAQGERLWRAVRDDLSRTPRRHVLRTAAAAGLEGADASGAVLAHFELRIDDAVVRPTLELARANDSTTPGWLVHAVIRAGAVADVETEIVDARSSWLGQLVARGTRRRESGSADAALARGIPGAVLVLPAGESAQRLLAATVRRLDGLDGYPVFEDQFLVVGGRVLLRRDLYWLGLFAWLGLFFKGRKRPGREFRWLLLVAWLVAPVHASLLLLLPALVATWLPESRWAAGLALAPVLIFTVRLAAALAGSQLPAVSGIPALLVLLALAAFTWQHLLARPALGRDRRPPPAAALESEPDAP